MMDPHWPQDMGPYMDALSEAKDKGLVRAVGISAHNLGALETAATCPWVDVVLARINPRGAKMDGTVEEVVPVLRKIKENGKALIGMKIFGEGTLMDQKDECIRYATDFRPARCHDDWLRGAGAGGRNAGADGKISRSRYR